MIYTICVQPATPRMDALPIYKIIDYPLEQRDYKPFAQVRLCVTPTHLVLELWAFEMHPRPESRLRAVFTTRESQELLFVECWATGRTDCWVRTPAGDRSVTVTSHSLGGEDLQGVYWGAGVHLPRTLLEGQFGRSCVQVGGILLGNVYKLSDSPEKPHKGSLFPADFAGGREYALPSMGEFQIVNY